uniref:Ribosomal protein L16 n=1 Tax=Chloropicon maureeniae TaxID=1461542 RepID=A0A4D6C4Y3_9CHLO|nr:ribosomal protein L16 [Chloropicon maureeniae]QBX98816.1 ribosomal protein L16 [Chloropicon maureeniae]
MLSPKRTKFRKFQRKSHAQKAICVSKKDLIFGTSGLKALQFGRIPARCLEAARRVMIRHFKRNARIWLRVFPHLGVSTKPAEVRMGKGKGPHAYWAACVRPGQVIFEFGGIDPQIAKEAARLGGTKLPVKTQFILEK